jgi:hypothetical protein
VFKQIARHNWVCGTMPGFPSAQGIDRANIQTAWKYVYLLRAWERLTRYIE